MRPRTAARRRSSCRRAGRADGGAPRPGRRPVSGLASLGRPPSRRALVRSRQWRVGRPALAYRCGGSRGLARSRIRAAPHSRFTRREGFAADTCVARFYRRSPAGSRRARRRPAPRRRRAACYNPRPFNDFRPHRITAGPGARAVTPKLYIRTFGCQMNEYDSDKMADVLAAADGLALTDRPEDADVILFNTCSVREKAQERVFHDLGRVRALKAAQPGPHHRRRRLRREPGRRARSSGARPTSTSCSARRRCTGCPQLIRARRATGRAAGRHLAFPRSRSSTTCRRRASRAPSAFVSIMEGCSKYCTFCVVPYTRGEEVSRPFDDVLTEVADLADQGVTEVTLLGQNVNAYRGADGRRRRRSPTSRRCSNTSPRFPASSASATRRRTRRR